jgi:hypothetical protein
MEQLLLSALMSATSRRNDLAEYARLEYSRAEAPRIAAGRFGEPGDGHEKGEGSRPTLTEGAAEPAPATAPFEAPEGPGSTAVLSYGPRVLARPPQQVPPR